jgi:hypothetical protein
VDGLGGGYGYPEIDEKGQKDYGRHVDDETYRKLSKVSVIVHLHIKLTRSRTFENVSCLPMKNMYVLLMCC